jgi:hypothetical protein
MNPSNRLSYHLRVYEVTVLKKTLGPVRGAGDNCIMKSFIICSLLFTKHYKGDKITENEMNGACRTHVAEEKQYNISVVMPEKKRPYERYMHSIKIHLNEI